MADRGGTDQTTEQRKLRSETADDDGPVHELLTDGFDAASEVLVASIPFLTLTAIRDEAVYSYLVVFALAGLIAGVAVARGDRIDRLPPWRGGLRQLAVRGVAYNLALPAAVAVGGLAQVGPGEVSWAAGPVIVPAVVTGVVAGSVALAVPSITHRLAG